MSANAYTGVEVVLSGGALTNGQTLIIRDVQLEIGSYASPIEVMSIDKELVACQRYFETSYPIGSAVGSAGTAGYLVCIAPAVGAGSANFNIIFKESKRATPTVVAYSYSDGSSGFIRDIPGAANRAVSYGTAGTNATNFSNSGVTTAPSAHGAHFSATSEL